MNSFKFFLITPIYIPDQSASSIHIGIPRGVRKRERTGRLFCVGNADAFGLVSTVDMAEYSRPVEIWHTLRVKHCTGVMFFPVTGLVKSDAVTILPVMQAYTMFVAIITDAVVAGWLSPAPLLRCCRRRYRLRRIFLHLYLRKGLSALH